MTEQEWLVCDYPMGMVDYLGKAASDRKLNLLAAACFRRIWHLLPGPRSKHTVEVLEQYAEGVSSAQELDAARRECWEDAGLVDNPEGNKHPSEIAIAAVSFDNILDMLMTAAEATAWVKAGTPEAISEPEERAQCGVIREIFGNPLQPIAVDSAWLAWNDGAIRKMALAIYDARAFDRLPLLADALEDAGCTNADILAHCRSGGEHVRGCWVVDLLLGKE
jgi:hypothetical protein